jgi:hypothetical protein
MNLLKEYPEIPGSSRVTWHGVRYKCGRTLGWIGLLFPWGRKARRTGHGYYMGGRSRHSTHLHILCYIFQIMKCTILPILIPDYFSIQRSRDLNVQVQFLGYKCRRISKSRF